jgi:hypothetical protein
MSGTAVPQFLYTAPGAGVAPWSATRVQNAASAAAGSCLAQVRQMPLFFRRLTGLIEQR